MIQIQEGLSPNHLKKAKLMFFYTRYPSSNMLKMFFSDVKVRRRSVSFLSRSAPSSHIQFKQFETVQMAGQTVALREREKKKSAS